MSFIFKDIDVTAELAQTARASIDNKRFIYRFDKALEAIYRQYVLARYQLDNRFYPIFGALVLVAFLFADNLVIPELITEMLTIRGVGAAIILAFVGVNFYVPVPRWHQFLVCFVGLLIHLSLVFIAVVAANHGQYYYQFGPIITIFFISNVMRVSFLYALPFVLIMLSTQIFAITLFTDASNEQLIELFFVFSFVTFISLMVNGRMGHEVRRNFLRKILLRYEHEQLVKTQEELRKLSISDALTGLYNRRHFNKHLEREWLSGARQQSSLALIMIDVDDFKTYNDTQGHQKGDEALILIGKTLASCARRPDDMVARYGGEEFVAVLPQTDERSAINIAEKMLHSIFDLAIFHPQSPFDKRETISIGVCSVIPDQSLSTKDLLKCADDALYKSKHSGKNRISVGVCRSPSAPLID